MNVEYLTDAIILLSAAVIAVPLFQSVKLGAIPGFLMAGLLIGPSGLGYIENYDEIAHLAELGVVLLLFVIGVEINPSRLWRMKNLVIGLGSLQIVITGGLITLIVFYVFKIPFEIAMLIGLSLALSSTAFVVQLLKERKMLASEYGKPAIAVLLFQDLAVVPLLTYVALISTPELVIGKDIVFVLLEKMVLIFVIIVSVRYVLNPLFGLLARFGSPEIFTASALLLVLGTGQAMEGLGLTMAMGAFIAGLLIADSTYRHQILAEVLPFRGLLLGLFFMTMGMSLNFNLILQNPLTSMALLLLLLAVKFISLWPLARAFGVLHNAPISLALLLAQSGEFALVVFAIAKQAGLMDEFLFQQLLVVIILSMLVTPMLAKLASHIDVVKPKVSREVVNIQPPEQQSHPVVLVGYGRMGHRIGYIMQLMKVPFVAIDNNPALVERAQFDGKAVYFGDAQRTEVLRAAGVDTAPLVIVSIDDLEATERVVATLHGYFANIPVFARGHDLVKCRELSEAGAQYTVSETLEASAELARIALMHLGANAPEVADALEHFRKDYYGRIQKDMR